jgi:hypothetical protein
MPPRTRRSGNSALVPQGTDQNTNHNHRMQVRTHTRGENANAGVSAAGAGPGRKLSVLLSVRALV